MYAGFPTFYLHFLPVYPVFLPPLYSTGHIREIYGTNTGGMREKGAVGMGLKRE
jgi:hypothetical protein